MKEKPKIWFGIKYSCKGWNSFGSFMFFIPTKIKGITVYGEFNGYFSKNEIENFPLACFHSDSEYYSLEPMNKIVRDTELARKMYKSMIVSELGGFLEVGCE